MPLRPFQSFVAMEAQQPRLRLASCGRHPGVVRLCTQQRRPLATHALPPPGRRNGAGSYISPQGKDYLNLSFSDMGEGDDINGFDPSIRYDDFIRPDNGVPAYTNTRNGRQRQSGNSMAWIRYDNNDLYGYDEFEDEYLDEYNDPRPATLSEEKRSLNGKQILTNYDITQPLLRIIGEKKEQMGMMKREDALQAALEAGVDLLLINPQEAPPVARLMKWSKFKFEIEQGEKAKKSKAVVVETKEVRLSPKTDDHDIATKIKTSQKFLEKGNKVKLVMQFQGRQLQHKDHGKEVLLKFIADLGESAKVEGPLSFKGAMYQVVLVPGKPGSGSAAPSTSGNSSSSNSNGNGRPATQASNTTAPARPGPSLSAPGAASAPTSAPLSPPPPTPPGPSIARPPLPPGQFTRPGAPPMPSTPPLPPRPSGAPAGAPMRQPMPPSMPSLQPLRPQSPPLQPASRPATNYQPVGARQP